MRKRIVLTSAVALISLVCLIIMFHALLNNAICGDDDMPSEAHAPGMSLQYCFGRCWHNSCVWFVPFRMVDRLSSALGPRWDPSSDVGERDSTLCSCPGSYLEATEPRPRPRHKWRVKRSACPDPNFAGSTVSSYGKRDKENEPRKPPGCRRRDRHSWPHRLSTTGNSILS